MNICFWSSASFERSYASYHLMKEILLNLLKTDNDIWLVQEKRYDGRMPEELTQYSNLHVINIPVKNIEKTSFVKRYLTEMKYYSDSIKRINKLMKMDVFFVQSTNVAYIPVLYCKRKHIPVAYNVQDVFPLDALAIGKLKKTNPAFIVCRKLQRVAYRKSDRIITISEDLASTIKEEEHGFRQKHGLKEIEVIYNWGYRNEAYNIPDSQNHFLKTYNIKREDGFRVVYAGNIGQMMDAEMLIQTAKATKEYKNILYYIIGTGSNIAYLKHRISEESIDSIRFYPMQPLEYAPDNYCMADVNINPVPKGVIYTCMPSKTNTCLLSRKPTIVSMDLNSDMAQKLKRVDLWTVVQPGDYKAMARGIIEYYRNRNKTRLSKDSAVFLSNLGPMENAQSYVEIIVDIASRIKE